MALANPLAASLTAELLAGWSFAIVGVIALFPAFSDQGWRARIFTLLLGLLILLIGINLIAHPLRGLLSLTYVVAVFMMITGIVRLVLAFSAELRAFRLIMIISGALSIILAMMIFSNFPQSAAVVLGAYLGIELISNGVSLITISLARKSNTSAEA
jgi:uncharacterized membrane protein HdeD (DUF308 family)